MSPHEVNKLLESLHELVVKVTKTGEWFKKISFFFAVG